MRIIATWLIAGLSFCGALQAASLDAIAIGELPSDDPVALVSLFIEADAARVQVRYGVLGITYEGEHGNPILEPLPARVQQVEHTLERQGSTWKIVAPQDGPHISVAHALAVRYARYCRAHDCEREPAIRPSGTRMTPGRSGWNR